MFLFVFLIPTIRATYFALLFYMELMA